MQDICHKIYLMTNKKDHEAEFVGGGRISVDSVNSMPVGSTKQVAGQPGLYGKTVSNKDR